MIEPMNTSEKVALAKQVLKEFDGILLTDAIDIAGLVTGFLISKTSIERRQIRLEEHIRGIRKAVARL